MDELFSTWCERYQPMQIYLRVGLSSPAQASFILICMGDSAGVGYCPLVRPDMIMLFFKLSYIIFKVCFPLSFHVKWTKLSETGT